MGVGVIVSAPVTNVTNGTVTVLVCVIVVEGLVVMVLMNVTVVHGCVVFAPSVTPAAVVELAGGMVGLMVGINVMLVGTSVQIPGFWGMKAAQMPAK